MEAFDWQARYGDRVQDAATAAKAVRSGHTVFVATGAGQPNHLVEALAGRTDGLSDVTIIQMLPIGASPWLRPEARDRFKLNTFFISDDVRDAVAQGLADYTPLHLSSVPDEFESGRIPIDVALVTVAPPDSRGLCSLGASVDVTHAAATNARYVIAQVNQHMPRTFGESFLHVNQIDVLTPFDAPLPCRTPVVADDTAGKIGEHIARLIEDGSTIQLGIGDIPQAIAPLLRDKRDLGVHTELVSDWIIELIESGAVNGARKSIHRNKVVASFCLGSQALYEYIDGNPMFELHPTSYVNDLTVIAQHDRMIAVNAALEIDLTGQVCADSIGERFYSGYGGQVDFGRGALRSREGKSIIAMPSTARGGEVSRITAALTPGAGVVTSRAEVQYVVTEFGSAYLRGKTVRERAMDLISLAHPRFRNALLQEAKRRKLIEQDQIELPWDSVRYPEELERYATLRDGSQIFFRPVKPTDEEELSEMLYSLSAESVATRFFTGTMTFPHRDVQHLTNIDYKQNLAIVGVVPGPAGEEQIVAIAQYFVEPGGEAAEAAFIVQDAWQAKGIGSFLMRYLAEIAIERGLKTFHAKVLSRNTSMLAVFQNSGHPCETAFDGDAYTVTIDLTR